MTRVLFRRLGTALGVVSMLVGVLAGIGGSVALAAPLTINVPCNTDSLISAINSANATTSGGTLLLSPHCTYTITTPATAPTGLPAITGNVTIKGQAATITRDSDANTPEFRIFDVAAGATLNIDFLTISNGKTGALGGAIQFGGTGTISNSTLSGNIAANGGAIAVSVGADLTVTTSTFSENTASGVGGGAILVWGTAHISRSAFLGNTAPINGGAINVQPNGLLTLFSSTLANNTSRSLGGAVSNLGVASLTNLTFVGNGGADGDAVATANSAIRLSNSILNDVSDHSECSPAGAISGDYNLVSDDSCGTSSTSHVISPSNPLSLGPLQFNGGPTQTMLPSAHSFNVIDQIPVESCVAPDASALAVNSTNPDQTIAIKTDQVGIQRPQGSRCDIGAVEVPKNPVLFPVLTTVAYSEQGHNISSRGLTVRAVNISPLDEPWDGTKGNFQRAFTFNGRMAGGGGYQLVVFGPRLSRGTYQLNYQIEGDPAIYTIIFRVLR